MLAQFPACQDPHRTPTPRFLDETPVYLYAVICSSDHGLERSHMMRRHLWSCKVKVIAHSAESFCNGHIGNLPKVDVSLANKSSPDVRCNATLPEEAKANSTK